MSAMLNVFNNLNQLYSFYLVAKLGSFSKAAEKLCVTEPAVSIQIGKLEQSIGFKLIERGAKQISLTEKGKIVFQYCEKMASIVSELSQYVRQTCKYDSYVLNIGTTKSLAGKLLPKLLGVYLRSCSNVSLNLAEYSSEELLKGLIENKYDIAISGRVPYDPKIIEAIHFCDDIIYPVAHSSSPLLKRPVALEELSKEPLIVREKGSAARYNTMDHMIHKGLKPMIVMESGSTDFIKELIRQKRGYSFLPWFCITEELSSGEFGIIQIPELELRLPIDILYLKGPELTEATRNFISFLKFIKRPLLTEIFQYLEQLG